MSEDLGAMTGALFEEDGFMDKINGFSGEPDINSRVNAEFERIKGNFDFISDISNIKVEIDGDAQKITGTDSVGKEVDFSAAKAAYSEGNFGEMFDELGIDTSDPDVRQFVYEEKLSFDETPKGQQLKTATDTSTTGEKIAEKAPVPKTQAELEETCKKNNIDIDKANKDYADLRKEVLEAKTPEEAEEKVKEKTSSWKSKLLISLAVLVGIIKAYEDIKDAIEHIEHANSGCFMYPPNGGSRCKIDAMTCNQEDLDAADTICSPCVNTGCSGEWIPAKSASYCGCNTPVGDSPFNGYSSAAVTGINECTGGNNIANCPTKTTKETYSKGKSPFSCDSDNLEHSDPPPLGGAQQVACPSVSGCIARIEACADGSRCSPWCDSKNNVVLSSSGQIVKCESCNFWCAASSLMPDVFSWPDSLLGKIEKILLWICIAIAVIAVIYFVGKELLHWLFSKKEKDRDIKVNITPIVKDAKAGFRRKK